MTSRRYLGGRPVRRYPIITEVVDSKGEYMAVAYGNMVALLIEAIKEQQVQITELKRRIS